jgi:hypothetical protein
MFFQKHLVIVGLPPQLKQGLVRSKCLSTTATTGAIRLLKVAALVFGWLGADSDLAFLFQFRLFVFKFDRIAG